jgi:hypothetical protein
MPQHRRRTHQAGRPARPRRHQRGRFPAGQGEGPQDSRLTRTARERCSSGPLPWVARAGCGSGRRRARRCPGGDRAQVQFGDLRRLSGIPGTRSSMSLSAARPVAGTRAAGPQRGGGPDARWRTWPGRRSRCGCPIGCSAGLGTVARVGAWARQSARIRCSPHGGLTPACAPECRPAWLGQARGRAVACCPAGRACTALRRASHDRLG